MNFFTRPILGFSLVLACWMPAAVNAQLRELPEAPEFITEANVPLFDGYKIVTKRNLDEYDGYIGQLNEKYSGALVRAKEKMVKLGAARAAITLDEEIARIAAGDTKRSEDLDAAPDYVRDMRKQYDQFLGRVKNLRRSRDSEALNIVDDRLAKMQNELTKANDLEKALQLRQYRETLRRPPTPVRPPAPPEPEVDPAEPVVGGGDQPVRPKRRNPKGDRPKPAEPDTPPEPEDDWSGDEGVPRAMTSEEREKFTAQLGPKPVKAGAGYQVMIDSISSGQVTEISLGKIKKWGSAKPKMFNGKPYWTATVSYPTTSLFGTFDTEGIAVIDGAKVIGWFYTGSGEEIP